MLQLAYKGCPNQHQAPRPYSSSLPPKEDPGPPYYAHSSSSCQGKAALEQCTAAASTYPARCNTLPHNTREPHLHPIQPSSQEGPNTVYPQTYSSTCPLQIQTSYQGSPDTVHSRALLAHTCSSSGLPAKVLGTHSIQGECLYTRPLFQDRRGSCSAQFIETKSESRTNQGNRNMSQMKEQDKTPRKKPNEMEKRKST